MKPRHAIPLLPLLAVEPLHQDLRSAAHTAKSLGYGGLAIGIGHPELNAEDFGTTAQRHLRKTLERQGVMLGALRVGVGQSGAFDSTTSQRLLDDALGACDLAHRLHTPLVCVYIGEPDDEGAIAGDVVEIVRTITVQADRTGITCALSCGQTAWLLKLLSSIDAPCLAANLDSLRILAAGGSPPDSAEALAGRIGLWTCADGIRSSSGFQITPLGAGRGAGARVVEILNDQDFTGPIIIDVRDFPDPFHAAANGIAQLKQWIRA